MTPEEMTEVGAFAGQQVDTGVEAEAFARYIGGHLASINEGATYSETSAAAPADWIDPEVAAELQGKADSLFKGEALRSILLNAYGWWTVATIALWAGDRDGDRGRCSSASSRSSASATRGKVVVKTADYLGGRHEDPRGFNGLGTAARTDSREELARWRAPSHDCRTWCAAPAPAPRIQATVGSYAQWRLGAGTAPYAPSGVLHHRAKGTSGVDGDRCNSRDVA